MKGVPAIPYLTIVRQYAFANGLRFFTWKEINTASYSYNEVAKINN